jgi:hypothetical protein
MMVKESLSPGLEPRVHSLAQLLRPHPTEKNYVPCRLQDNGMASPPFPA